METHQFQTPTVTPIAGWGATSVTAPRSVEPDAEVTLQLAAGDIRRIIRALEHTSLSLRGSPSGSRLAGNYMRLATAVRRQAEADS